jgi:hypothetical protein
MNPPLGAAQANYLNLPRSGPFVALDELAAIGAPVNPVLDFRSRRRRRHARAVRSRFSRALAQATSAPRSR